jgi:hypothetical protein
MAKKRPGVKVPATTTEPVMRHARIELPDPIYRRLKAAADRYQLSMAGYIRMAVVERIEADERKGGK